MTGSEKQIKWAEDIKAKFQKEWDLLKGKNPNFDKAINFFESVEDVEWWIEHQDYTMKALARRLMTGTRIGRKSYKMEKDGSISCEDVNVEKEISKVLHT